MEQNNPNSFNGPGGFNGPNGYNHSGERHEGEDHDKYLKGPPPIITVDRDSGKNKIALAIIILMFALTAFYLYADKVPIYIKMIQIDYPTTRPPTIKVFAAKELGKAKDKRAIGPLINALTVSGDPALWDAAVKALLKIGTVCPNGELRGTGCPDEKDSKTDAINATIIRDSLKIFLDKKYNNSYREWLSFCLAVGLKDKSVDIRILSAQLLSEFGRENAIEPLTDALKDGDLRVKDEAKISLGMIKKRAAKITPDPPPEGKTPKKPSDSELAPEKGASIPPENLDSTGPNIGTTPILKSSKTFTDLEKESKSLGNKLEPPFHFEKLINDLKSEDPNVRGNAVMTLGYLKYRMGTVHILPLLADPEESVRTRVAYSLGELNNFASVRPLLKAYKTAGSDEKVVIFHSLLKMNDPVVKAVLSEVSAEKDPEIAKIAAAVLYFSKRR